MSKPPELQRYLLPILLSPRKFHIQITLIYFCITVKDKTNFDSLIFEISCQTSDLHSFLLVKLDYLRRTAKVNDKFHVSKQLRICNHVAHLVILGLALQEVELLHCFFVDMEFKTRLAANLVKLSQLLLLYFEL